MYKRVLLKFSGEALHDNNGADILDVMKIDKLGEVISELYNQGTQIAIVIGAGNIWRGKLASKIGIEPVPADFMGMLGTVINCVALSSSLNKKGIKSVVLSAVPAIDGVTETYSPKLANKYLSENYVCFLAGGTGKPFYTTDTASTLRAIELNCDAILMGKNGVEGVFTADPTLDSSAEFIKDITYSEILKRKLHVMDLSAVELIQDKDIDIRVFSMEDARNFARVANGEDIGTRCHKE